MQMLLPRQQVGCYKLYKKSVGKFLTRVGLLNPSGPVDVQWTSIERPYRTTGRPKGTFNGRLVDVPNETQLVRPNRTKMDVHFRPSRDDGHGT